MMTRKILLASASFALVSGLSACADNDAEDATVTEVDETVSETVAYDPLIELSPTQQAQRDAMDQVAYEEEVNRYMEEDQGKMKADGKASKMSADNMSGNDDSMSGRDKMADSLPPASEMTFATVDRNSDGKLNVAEYAIYAVRANPMQMKKNDENKPYVSTKQLNEAADTFFFFDKDEDTYLSESEFASAKQSARVPS